MGLAPHSRAASPKKACRSSSPAERAERLATVATEIREAGGSSRAVVTDATREKDVVSLLDEVGPRGSLDLVAYNVGNNAMIPLLADQQGAV